jgi:putative ubiquitin-RnfH superfamily antitoxin RatB of RatAB toxin-antitoxin module
MTDRASHATIRVEVAYAEPDRQFLRALELDAGATVADAIAASGLACELPLVADDVTVGIWSKPCTRDRVLQDGDRIELYRPLKADPKEARRRRAALKTRRG